MDILPGFKLCRKKLHQYPQNKRTCPTCKYLNNQKWSQANKEKILASSRKWQESNREKQRLRCRNWYELNKEKHLQDHKKWAKNYPKQQKIITQRWRSKNKHVLTANAAKRRGSKKTAVPPWANLNKIKQIYKRAAELTRQTGVIHHVDHIYPLQSKYMCGLHVETNLQVITEAENLTKGNRTWPGQLDCQRD